MNRDQDRRSTLFEQFAQRKLTAHDPLIKNLSPENANKMLDFFLDQNAQMNVSNNNETDESDKNLQTPGFHKQDKTSQYENESAEVADDDEERGANITTGMRTRFSNIQPPGPKYHRANSKMSSNSHDSYDKVDMKDDDFGTR